MLKRGLFASIALACATAGSASAMSLTAAEALAQFSIVTGKDLDTNQDNYGRAYVGGDLNVTAGKADFANRDLPESSYAALTVAGDVTGGTARVGNNGSSMVIGGNVTARELQFAQESRAEVHVGGKVSSHTTVRTANGVKLYEGQAGQAGFEDRFPTDLTSVLAATSTTIAGMAATTKATLNGGGNTMKIDANTGGVNVVNLDAADLDGRGVGQIQFNLGATDTLYINVAGAAVDLMVNLLGLQDADGRRIIWNFHEATEVDLDRKMFGTILAGHAHLTNSTAIEGSVFAGSATLRGQVHLQSYNGAAPTMAPIPLPATLPMLAAGFGALAWMRRRRTAAA